MPRTLLLCFIHGFKGTDNTFHDFPYDLRNAVAKSLPDDKVQTVVYPQYETKGELVQATASFLEWLKAQVMEIRKKQSATPWPPHDRDVGVVLVAHSMGGFVAADTLFQVLNDRAANPNENDQMFPLIQGILTYDTPYNGLARSMFVYGAFSNYQKVSSVFNVMTALSAAAPASLARLSARSATSSAVSSSRGPQWKAWQLVAVRTGTVGAIAAGGVAAYMNREAIIQGVKSMRNINKDTIAEGYRHGMDTLGQGLAYINRGNVGKSFAWLSDHFTFVGALMKQQELNRRLERLGALKGIGLHDFYCSLGANGYWSGGYFVPERTFCAVPEESHQAHSLFTRCVMGKLDDEVEAHVSMFRPDRHAGYEEMTEKSAALVREWFLSEEEVFDDPKFQQSGPEEAAEDKEVEEILQQEPEKLENPETDEDKTAEDVPDESPIDIAAAASLVPLPNDEGDLVADASKDEPETQEKRNYMNHLFQIAQQAGTGLTEAKGWLPSKLPNMPTLPSMPKVPASVSSLGQVSMPSMNIFGKKDEEKRKATEEVSGKETEALKETQ